MLTISSQSNIAPISSLSAAPHQISFKKLKKLERITLGLKIFFSVLSTLGIALAVRRSCNCIKIWYQECRSGRRKIALNPLNNNNLQNSLNNHLFILPKVDLLPKDALQIPQISISTDLKLGLEAKQDLPSHVRNFLDLIRKNPFATSISWNEFSEVLKFGQNIKDPFDKTSIFEAAEILSRQYLAKGDHQKAFQIRLQTARAVSPVAEFANLGTASPKGDSNLGYRIQPLGTSSIKNQTIKIQKREYVCGKKCIRVEARLQNKARVDLEETINSLKKNPQLLSDAFPQCGEISISTEQIQYHLREKIENQWSELYSTGDAFSFPDNYHVIDFPDVGKVFIGINPDSRTEYRHLTIELDSNVKEEEAGEKLHIIFAALGLGSISSHSRPEDIQRIKVMQLFRHFFPIESNQDPFNKFLGPVNSLKEEISKAHPTMKEKFNHYLNGFPNKMYQQEVLPGQFVWCVDGLAKEASDQGAKILMSSMKNFNAENIASMLKIGALSAQERMSAGIGGWGWGMPLDFARGGAESVFATLITKKAMDKVPISKFLYPGSVKVFYDLKLLERIGYSFFKDCFGAKDSSYVDPKKRKNILELVNEIYGEEKYKSLTSNDVCIHAGILPEYIKGILVDSNAKKKEIISKLQKEGVIKNGCINNVSIDKFIRVSKWTENYKEEHWTS